MNSEKIKKFLQWSLLSSSATLSIGFGIAGLYGKLWELKQPVDGIHGVELMKVEHYKNRVGGDIHSCVEGDKIYVEGCKEPIYFTSGIGNVGEGDLSIIFKRRSLFFGGGLEGLSIGPCLYSQEDRRLRKR